MSFWTDIKGRQHRIADMTMRYRRNCLGLLARRPIDFCEEDECLFYPASLFRDLREIHGPAISDDRVVAR